MSEETKENSQAAIENVEDNNDTKTPQDVISKEAYEGQKKRAEKAEAAAAELKAQIAALTENETPKNQKPTPSEQREDIEDITKKDNISVSDLDSYVEKYGADPQAMKDLRKALGLDDRKVLEKLESIEKRQKMEDLDKTFKQVLDKTLEERPEFKDVVNANVIKKLLLDPDNKEKTVEELIEETYGNVTFSKYTLESARKKSSVDDLTDFSDIGSNTEKLAKIKANPETNKKYRAWIAEQGRN